MQIKDKASTLRKDEYYMYGAHAVIAAALNPNRKIIKIFCLAKAAPEFNRILLKSNHKIEIVDNHFIISKIGKDHPHQGIIALVKTIFKTNLEELNFNSNCDRIAILDQISDPQNIGAIIRSAAAFGINKIILPRDNTPEENASIAKAASGCLELVEVAKVTNLNQAIKQLKNKGFWILGLDIKGTDHISQTKELQKIGIVIGSEGKGMRKLTTESCDFLLKIPIAKEVESLNASAAASIIFYLFSK